MDGAHVHVIDNDFPEFSSDLGGIMGVLKKCCLIKSQKKNRIFGIEESEVDALRCSAGRTGKWESVASAHLKLVVNPAHRQNCFTSAMHLQNCFENKLQ